MKTVTGRETGLKPGDAIHVTNEIGKGVRFKVTREGNPLVFSELNNERSSVKCLVPNMDFLRAIIKDLCGLSMKPVDEDIYQLLE